MSIPNVEESNHYISSLKKTLKKSGGELYIEHTPRNARMKFHEGTHLGIKYIIAEKVYQSGRLFFDAIVLISIPCDERSTINYGITDAFEKSIFGKLINEVDSPIADELDYYDELAEKEKIQFPHLTFDSSDYTFENAENLVKGLVELYDESVKSSRNKWFKEMTEELYKRWEEAKRMGATKTKIEDKFKDFKLELGLRKL